MNAPPYGPVEYSLPRGAFTPTTISDKAEHSLIHHWIADGQPLLNADGQPSPKGPPMELREVQQILAKCAAFDARKPDPGTVMAWADALDPEVTLRDALEAVTAFYSQHRERIMPSDVNAGCRAIRGARIFEEEQRRGHVLPQGLGDTPVLETAWRREALRQIGMGATRDQASVAAWHAIGMTPPPPEIDEPHAARLLVDQVAGSRRQTETPSSSIKREEN
jgi:hypothetical protein